MAEAEGAAGAVQSTGVNVGKGLTSKIGPLPLWGWLAVAGVGIAGYFLFIAPNQGGGSSAGSGMLPGDLIGGGGGGGTSSTSTSTGAYASNTAWVTGAASTVATQLGLPLSEVTSYLNQYLQGQAPQGSYGAVSTFDNVVAAAVQAAGAPPQPVISGTANPFQTNATWLQAILQALPSGTSQSTMNDIINLVNGTVGSISQTSATTFQNAINVVGQGPTPIVIQSYAPLSQTVIQAWSNAFHAAPSQDFNTWLSLAPQAITSVVPQATLQAIYNFHATSAGQAAVTAAGGALNWWQSYLANPTAVPLTGPVTNAPVAGANVTSAVIHV